jgi:hypothetical protein
MHALEEQEEFWSGSYRGHSIAILNHGDRWLVYLDHILQNKMQFATADAALAWLLRRVDTLPGRTRPREADLDPRQLPHIRTRAAQKMSSAPFEPALAAFGK